MLLKKGGPIKFFIYCTLLYLCLLTSCSQSKDKVVESISSFPAERIKTIIQALANQEDNVTTTISETKDSASSLTTYSEEQMIIERYTTTNLKDFQDLLMPEDFFIGPLQNLIESYESELIITQVIRDFFSALYSGKIKTKLIMENNRQSLINSINFHVIRKRVPSFIRIGRIEVSGTTAFAKIRLFNSIGRTSGEIYLTSHDDSWKISDIQIDFQELDKVYSNTDLEFWPQKYRMVILN